MQLTALALVKLDGDIIEEFVRHTLRFADRLIVVDNASLDSTREILAALVAEDLPVVLWDEEIIAERPSITTELARKAFAEFSMDYLLILDADEFIKAPSRAALESALAELPPGAHALVPWVTYVPTLHDDRNEPRVLARLKHRRVTESRPYSKLFLSNAFAECPELAVSFGNHFIEDSQGVSRTVELAGVQLAHFPVRSVGQIQCKALLGWSQYLAMGFDREGEIAYQWQRLYEKLRRNPNWSETDFLQAAWHYLDDDDGEPDLIADAIPAVACKYPPASPELLGIAVAYTRQLAKAYARLAAERNAAT
ncbi:MAG: glycosyltransferase family 2 protein [Candidatus Eremiobacteraeota bacterium]|nr:glycosyltransferase family 2 protein [Candidatus Eremiobacteraeota bacterium]